MSSFRSYEIDRYCAFSLFFFLRNNGFTVDWVISRCFVENLLFFFTNDGILNEKKKKRREKAQ